MIVAVAGRASARAPSACAVLRRRWSPAVLITGGVMAYGYYANRYTSEFVPALVLGGAVGTVLRRATLAVRASGPVARAASPWLRPTASPSPPRCSTGSHGGGHGPRGPPWSATSAGSSRSTPDAQARLVTLLGHGFPRAAGPTTSPSAATATRSTSTPATPTSRGPPSPSATGSSIWPHGRLDPASGPLFRISGDAVDAGADSEVNDRTSSCRFVLDCDEDGAYGATGSTCPRQRHTSGSASATSRLRLLRDRQRPRRARSVSSAHSTRRRLAPRPARLESRCDDSPPAAGLGAERPSTRPGPRRSAEDLASDAATTARAADDADRLPVLAGHHPPGRRRLGGLRRVGRPRARPRAGTTSRSLCARHPGAAASRGPRRRTRAPAGRPADRLPLGTGVAGPPPARRRRRRRRRQRAPLRLSAGAPPWRGRARPPRPRRAVADHLPRARRAGRLVRGEPGRPRCSTAAGRS